MRDGETLSMIAIEHSHQVYVIRAMRFLLYVKVLFMKGFGLIRKLFLSFVRSVSWPSTYIDDPLDRQKSD